jgi:hypothetical protein
MAIHKLEYGRCVISSHQVWMPGCYVDEKAAKYAFRFSDETLRRLQNEANERNGGFDGVITTEDLKKAYKSDIELKKSWKIT